MSSEGEKYTSDTFTKLLLEPLNLNFNTIRSSYVSDFYIRNPYPLERNDLARQMRHSASVANLKYLKRLPKEEEKEQVKEQQEQNKKE
jgi:hypothetical protein